MTVGIITNSYPPNLNGVAVCVKNLENELINKGINVVIVTPKVPGVEYSDNVYQLPSAPAPTAMSKDLRLTFTYNDKKVIQFLKDNNVSVLHSHDTIMGAQDTIMIGQQLKIPVIHTYHTYLESYGYFKLIGYKIFIRNYSRFICDYSDGVVVLSTKMNKYLLSIGVKSKMYQLPNVYLEKSIDGTKLPKPQYFIEENLLEHTFNILMFGRLAKEKNIINSIEIIRPLFIRYPKLRLVILGDGPMYAEIKEYLDENELNKRVLLYGAFNYTDLSVIANESKLYFNTSVTEVLPTTLIEAASFSLPLVTVDDSAYEYLLKDGVNGYFSPISLLEEKLETLILDEKLRAKMSLNSKQSFFEYQAVNYGKKYIEMYEDVVNNYIHKNISLKLLNSFQTKLKTFVESIDLNLFDYWRK